MSMNPCQNKLVSPFRLSVRSAASRPGLFESNLAGSALFSERGMNLPGKRQVIENTMEFVGIRVVNRRKEPRKARWPFGLEVGVLRLRKHGRGVPSHLRPALGPHRRLLRNRHQQVICKWAMLDSNQRP